MNHPSVKIVRLNAPGGKEGIRTMLLQALENLDSEYLEKEKGFLPTKAVLVLLDDKCHMPSCTEPACDGQYSTLYYQAGLSYSGLIALCEVFKAEIIAALNSAVEQEQE